MSKIPDCRTDEYYNQKYQKIKEHVDGRQGKAENG